MIGKVDQVPDQNEGETPHGCPHDLVEQRKRFLPLRFNTHHLLHSGANGSIDQREQDRNKEYIKHLLVHRFINVLIVLDKIAHNMGNQEANNCLGHQHMVEKLCFPGSQGQVKKYIHQNKGAPAYKLAQPVI